MKKMYTKYDETTGEIEGIFSGIEADAALNTCIEGEYSAEEYRIIDGLPVAKSASEIEAKRLEELTRDVRFSRNAELKKTDWTQISDAPVDQTAWATYRQALRDLPDQEGFPDNVVWPTKP